MKAVVSKIKTKENIEFGRHYLLHGKHTIDWWQLHQPLFRHKTSKYDYWKKIVFTSFENLGTILHEANANTVIELEKQCFNTLIGYLVLSWKIWVLLREKRQVWGKQFSWTQQQAFLASFLDNLWIIIFKNTKEL